MINPYQPPESETRIVEKSDAPIVTIANNSRLRRLSTNQYLLRCHPRRLFFSSLLMIAVSTVCIHFSVQAGFVPFAITLLVVMSLTTSVYLALVKNTKQKIEFKRDAFGLLTNEPYSLKANAEAFQLETARGQAFNWNYSDVRLYRTSRGTLVSPETHVFFLIPRLRDANLAETKRFVDVVKARLD